MYFSSCIRRGPAAVFLKLRQQLRDDAFPLAAVLPDRAAALLPLADDVRVAAAVEQRVRGAPPAASSTASSGRCRASCATPSKMCLRQRPMPLQRADERNRAVVEAQRRIGDEQVRVERELVAQAVAVEAHALRAVEAEQLRPRRLVADVAVRAGVVRGEQDVSRVGSTSAAAFVVVRLGRLRLGSRPTTIRFPRRERERLLDRLRQPRAAASASAFSRSMTTSMSCLMRRSSFRSSVSRTTWPSTRARTKPRFSMSAKRSLYSPFCPRTTGASTRNRVPSGSARMRPMICSRVWAVIGRPHFGQWPWPTRA